MILSAIVAMSEDGLIGTGNNLPWHLPHDLKRFKSLTMGHPMVMGRKTYEAIGRPLPGRTSIVLTRNPEYRAPEGVVVVPSLEQALNACPEDTEVFVIGGAAVYRAALPRVERLYVTLVHGTPEGDIYFPDEDLRQWQLVQEEHHEADETHAYPFSFLEYHRSSRS